MSKANSKRSPRSLNLSDSSQTFDIYPIPAYLDFVPGGIEYDSAENNSDPAASSTTKRDNLYQLNYIAPDSLVYKAHAADEILRKYSIRYAAATVTGTDKGEELDVKKLPHRLPSLSILAEAAFGSLTGVCGTTVRTWADEMVLAYLHDNNQKNESKSEIQDILSIKDKDLVNQFEQLMNNAPSLSPAPIKKSSAPSSPTHHQKNDLVSILKDMRQKQLEGNGSESSALSPLPIRPCGYVFKRNDIGWNCRTCQTDSTCVLCDTCFHNSNHEGHEVYFHRTNPGGCCDCGDAEAWKVEGCCPAHRPKTTFTTDDNICVAIDGDEDMTNSIENSMSMTTEESLDFEAVKASLRGRMDGEVCVNEMLPPRFAAALGVVIGAAVYTVVQAMDGAAIGTDLVQWTRRWADQIRKLKDGRSNDEEYVISTKSSCANSVGEAMKLKFPNKFKLHLRLHNDDIHTYDEVIKSLFLNNRRNTNVDPNRNEYPPETDTTTGLVPNSDTASELTTRVDTDGQVVVRAYSTMEGAMAGYDRLKRFGLHCSVVSTPQIDLELRARVLLSWLSDISAAHPAVAAIVVHALVDVTEGFDSLGGLCVWPNSRTVPPWSFTHGYFSSTRVSIHEEEEEEEIESFIPGWRQRMDVFPPNLQSTFLTREESWQLHNLGLGAINEISSPKKGVDLNFYSKIPYMLPSERFRKSPHSLWGIMPSPFTSPKKYSHPFLSRDTVKANQPHYLVESLIVLDTDLRKQQETDMLINECHTHSLLGLHMISGVGLVDVVGDEHGGSAMKPTAEEWGKLLSMSSYRAPVSPILLMLLLDPYSPKHIRSMTHPFYLSLLVDSRFKARFAASVGGIAYRSLTTLYCSGVGTDIDSPLGFTVQIFTTGSLVRALCNPDATKKLLTFDGNSNGNVGFDDAFTIPVAHNIVRCIHSNLLGECEEVKMVMKNTAERRSSLDALEQRQRNKHLMALIYQHGESPLTTLLPAAPDDAFLESRSIKHKRLPPLIRDLEYVFETPGTALRLLLRTNNESVRAEGDMYPEIPHFPTMWCRLLRLIHGVDPQKRKISGGHVEYENTKWLEAYSLSLHLAGASSKLAESLSKALPNANPPAEEAIREGMGNCFVAILREIKWWLYKEYILDSGIPQTQSEKSQMDCLQRSTLHISMSTLGVASVTSDDAAKSTALNCQINTKMNELHLEMLENAIRIEQSQYQLNGAGRGAIMGDWLRVPHSPHAGDTLSFHLPLHRAFARNIRSLCSLTVTERTREISHVWWLLPTIDTCQPSVKTLQTESFEHPLSVLLRPALRSSNCRVTWAAGPDCNSEEAQRRRSRSRTVSAAITASKIIHSLCDHPLRCLAAAEQISRHLWLRNGASASGMALNYSSPPLCQSFRDLDLTMVQLSACGLSIGLGAHRVFNLMLSRFSVEGFLCDPEKKTGNHGWVMPPILQDPDHASSLAEALFTTLCVLVTELPPPPPSSVSDSSSIRIHVRREILHSLSVNSLSYSKAMEAASNAISRKDATGGADVNEDGPTSFRTVFDEVLREISYQKTQGSRSTAAPSFELNNNVSDEYDPTFFHLKRVDHQHAMDNIARLRKQKFSSRGKCNSKICLPLVKAPPLAHPRFQPCRLILHIPALDAAIRRALIFALTGGEWLPPRAPIGLNDENSLDSPSFSSEFNGEGKSSKARRVAWMDKNKPEFSAEVVDSSSISFLEVLQLLTLQVHTLEECANLHATHPNLDHESKSLSASISINSYLGRLVHVPSSLVHEWAFRCAPDGPLPSKGSGLNRASILGLLIALLEHKSDYAQMNSDDSGHGGEDGLGGARFLVASGLKWLLRFVSSLVQGASSVGVAYQSALNGIPIKEGSNTDTTWTIDSHLKHTIKGMLENIPGLWPDTTLTDSSDNMINDKSREAMKAAKMRAIERMKKQQASFMKSISNDEKVGITTENSDEETDLCIICRCDDKDGINNGPMGFLGHVQRSRTMQLRCNNQSFQSSSNIALTYVVVGDMGCQLRAQKSMDSAPVECIPTGNLVTVLKPNVVSKYGLKSRRVLVRHVSPLDGKMSEGWASVQSAQGYTILSPIVDLCYSKSRWGCTRPFIRLCGHAAHLGCVDAHVASIHQKAERDTPFDGRFAAEIADGEFLCPLCKQISNIVIPVDENKSYKIEKNIKQFQSRTICEGFETLRNVLTKHPGDSNLDGMKTSAVKQFGTYLYQAMEVTSWRRRSSQPYQWDKKNLKPWDYRENNDDVSTNTDSKDISIDDILPMLRQQHVAWASVGHGAAAAEASARGIKRSSFEPPTCDPWVDFNSDSRDSHPMLLELRRILVAASSLQEIVSNEIFERLSVGSKNATSYVPIAGCLLSQIIEGTFWTSKTNDDHNDWSTLTALLCSLPCHVARDETLSERHEARATAAQIWAIQGQNVTKQDKINEIDAKTKEESKKPSPPVPLCVRNIPGYQEKLKKLWGSMKPEDVMIASNVFRPALASAYLYIPLLAWDLNTFAGALFSTLLSSRNVEPDCFWDAAKILLVARLIQVLITINGINDVVCNVAFECEMNVEKESCGIISLSEHCNALVNPGRKSPIKEKDDGISMLSFVSYAVIPYARSLVLLLRASFSSMRQRGYELNNEIEAFVEDEDIMYIDDGMYFMQKFGCPMPSELSECLATRNELDSNANMFWIELVNKWIKAVSSFDSYSGSEGTHLEYRDEQQDWVLVSPSMNTNKKFKSDKMSPKKIETVYEPHDVAMEIHNDDNYAESNDDQSMEDSSNLETQVAQFDFDQVDSALEMGIDFEDDVDIDDSTDVHDMFGLPSLPSQLSQDTSAIGQSEEESIISSSNDDSPSDDDLYANIASATIIPYQSSFFGNMKPGPGPRGSLFDYATASTIMSDLSHLGISHYENIESSGLIQLPKSYVELYSLVNKVKATIKNTSLDEIEDFGSGETAICLITGTILKASSPRRQSSRRYQRPPGACTLHARKIGSGTGIYFLLQKCTVLLIHNKKSAYYASLYVDENGEEDTGLARGRPLFLKEDRYEALANLWRTHSIPREVAQIRSTSDRVIRDDWY